MIRKKPALGLDRTVGTGFPKRSCSNKKIERDDDSKKSHPALVPRKSDEPRVGRWGGSAPARGVCHLRRDIWELPIEGDTCADQNACRAIIPNGSRGETQACANCAAKEYYRTISARDAISSKERRRPGLPLQVSVCSHCVPPQRNPRTRRTRPRTPAGRT